MKLLALVLATGCAQSSGPHLTSVTPSQGPYGSTVMLAGERLCDGECMTAGGEVTFGDARAPVVGITDTSVMVAVPGGAVLGKNSIVLTVNDTASNALAFVVVAP